MSREYLNHYERMCLEATALEIKRTYPCISIKQIKDDIELMKAMNTEWEKAKFRRFPQKIRMKAVGEKRTYKKQKVSIGSSLKSVCLAPFGFGIGIREGERAS